jgi:hypothetical protein
MYVKLDVSLAAHKKTRRLARLLGCSVPTAIGHLALLWIDCMGNSPDGDITDRGALEIAEASQWSGDETKFLDALLTTGFVDQDTEGALILHDWNDHTGKYLYKKEETRKRVQKLRDSRKGDVTRTSALPTTDVTRTSGDVTRTGTLPTPDVTRTGTLQLAVTAETEGVQDQGENESAENSHYCMDNARESEKSDFDVTRTSGDVTRTIANVRECNATYEIRREEKRSNSNTFPDPHSHSAPSAADLPGAFAPGENGGNLPVVDSNREGGDTGTNCPPKNRQRAEKSEKQPSPQKEASKKEAPTTEPWNAYAQAWEHTYGKPPTRGKMANVYIKQLLDVAERDYVIKFLAWYPTSKRAFEIRTTHSLNTIQANFDTLRIYFETKINPDDMADRVTKNRREGNALRKKLRDSGCAPVPF